MFMQAKSLFGYNVFVGYTFVLRYKTFEDILFERYVYFDHFLDSHKIEILCVYYSILKRVNALELTTCLE